MKKIKTNHNEIPLISVVVPTYNSEKYISNCLNSILNQTHQKIEVIVINDGSTDQTLEILNKFKVKDSRIKVINQVNKGVSFSRNLGIDNSKGEFVIFVDSDDFLTLDYIEYMKKMIMFNDSDFSFSINHHVNKISNDFFTDSKFTILTKSSALCYLLSPNLTVGCWNKIYNRNFLVNNNIRFDESLFYGEGLNFIIRCTILARKISKGNKRKYVYLRSNSLSATNSFNKSKFNNGENSLNTIFPLIKDFSIDVLRIYYSHLGLFLTSSYLKLSLKEIGIEKVDYIQSFLRRNFLNFLFTKNITFYRKLVLLIGSLSIRINYYIYNTLKFIYGKQI